MHLKLLSTEKQHSFNDLLKTRIRVSYTLKTTFTFFYACFYLWGTTQNLSYVFIANVMHFHQYCDGKHTRTRTHAVYNCHWEEPNGWFTFEIYSLWQWSTAMRAKCLMSNCGYEPTITQYIVCNALCWGALNKNIVDSARQNYIFQ